MTATNKIFPKGGFNNIGTRYVSPLDSNKDINIANHESYPSSGALYAKFDGVNERLCIDEIGELTVGGGVNLLDTRLAASLIRDIPTSTGAANVYAITLGSTLVSYVAGMEVLFLAHQNSTTTEPTLNVDGIGAVTIKSSRGTALGAGAILNGLIYRAYYDGTHFRLDQDYEGEFTWTPSYTASGSLSYGSVTTTIAKYKVYGKSRKYEFFHKCSGTTGGTTSTTIYHTLPIAPLAEEELTAVVIASLVDPSISGNLAAGAGFVLSSSRIGINNYNGSNWGLGAGREIFTRGVIRF